MSLNSIKKRTDWEQMHKEVYALIARLRRKPEDLKLGYHPSPGGILNAYLNGELTFSGAVKALEEWRESKVVEALREVLKELNKARNP